jgi:soluble lytic murein transglycosylase-like protein
MFNAGNTSPQSVISQVQQGLAQIRSAMQTAEALHDWAAAVAQADLTNPPPAGLGMPAADAQAILSACADAYGHFLLYSTGTDPRNPPAGYVYGASQKLVIGSRTS